MHVQHTGPPGVCLPACFAVLVMCASVLLRSARSYGACEQSSRMPSYTYTVRSPTATRTRGQTTKSEGICVQATNPLIQRAINAAQMPDYEKPRCASHEVVLWSLPRTCEHVYSEVELGPAEEQRVGHIALQHPLAHVRPVRHRLGQRRKVRDQEDLLWPTMKQSQCSDIFARTDSRRRVSAATRQGGFTCTKE